MVESMPRMKASTWKDRFWLIRDALKMGLDVEWGSVIDEAVHLRARVAELEKDRNAWVQQCEGHVERVAVLEDAIRSHKNAVHKAHLELDPEDGELWSVLDGEDPSEALKAELTQENP